MAFLSALWGFFASRAGRLLAVVAAVLGAVAIIYQKGRSDQSAKQERENLKEYINARKRADRAADRAERLVVDLADPDLNERLREHGALRD